MRHLKTDVSHRMKRRPSIFTALWFRAVLGLGVVVILGLLLGPSLTGWVRGDGRPAPASARATPKPLPAARPATSPATTPTPEPERREPPVAVSAKPPAVPAPAAVTPPTNGTATAPVGTPPRPPAETTATPAVPDKAAPVASPRAEAAASAPRGPAVYRVQVGAFLDHRNADRLIERLRSDGVDGIDTAVEETRTGLYRVLALPQDGEGYPLLLERLRGLGFTPEPTEAGAAVIRPAPLASAVEVSRRLKEQGIRVRLERQASSPGLRVVRVGAHATAEEAERTRTELASRGYEGFVIREPR
jgi:cell division septation protein DedD